MTATSDDENKQIYLQCFRKQLDELNLLSSIFCNPGEIHIYDANVISEFNDYIKGQIENVRSELDYSIYFDYNSHKVDIRIQLPYLYPLMENANVTLLTPLLSKTVERNAQLKIANFISTLDKSEGYIYQVVLWIQDEFENLMLSSNSMDHDQQHHSSDKHVQNCDNRVELERMWIYSHHIKSKIKRREILNQAKELNLTGFSKPGKPGIICVEGLKENTQEFWRVIRSMQWQRITLKDVESKRKTSDQINEWRRFPEFRELLMNDIDDGEVEAEKMDMSWFMKFLEKHKCGYMKNSLFGFD